ncbi:MAG: hypothetical protein ACPG6V_09275 [Flavobacteriales bacterium]
MIYLLGKVRSDNKPVEKALNTYRNKGLYLFFSITFSLIIFGFYMMSFFRVNDLFPLVIIFVSIGIGGLIAYLVSKKEIYKQLSKDIDCVEFLERLSRFEILTSKELTEYVEASNIKKPYRIKKSIQNLPDYRISDQLILSHDYLYIKNVQIKWTDIEDYSMYATNYEGTAETGFSFTLNNKRTKKIAFKITSIKKRFIADYMLDKYLNNRERISPLLKSFFEDEAS